MLNKLSSLQHKCDQISFDLQGKSIDQSSIDEILMHKELHLAKLLGKIATYLERRHHGIEHDTFIIENEVIPDLLVYCLQIAQIFHTDLNHAFIVRLDHIIHKGLRDYPARYDAEAHENLLIEATALLSGTNAKSNATIS